MSAYKLHSIFREFWRCGLTLMGKWPPSLCSASLAYSFCFEYRHSTVHLSTLQSALWWKGTWGKVQRTGSGERKGGAAESKLSLKCLLCALETSCSRNKMVFCQDSQSPGWRWENRPGGGWNCWCHRADLWVTHRKMCSKSTSWGTWSTVDEAAINHKTARTWADPAAQTVSPSTSEARAKGRSQVQVQPGQHSGSLSQCRRAERGVPSFSPEHHTKETKEGKTLV